MSASEEKCEEMRPGEQSEGKVPNFRGVRGLSTIPLRRALIGAAMLAIVCALVMVPIGNGVTNKAQAIGGVKNFTILHTNDEHSDIYPYALSYDTKPTTGGFARLATAIKSIKDAKDAINEPVLTLGAGDWAQGTLFSWMEMQPAPTYPAAPELTCMQIMGYDAVTFGNHDVELGPQYLSNAAGTGELDIAAAGVPAYGMPKVTFPILSSNIQFSGNPPTTGADKQLYDNFWNPTPSPIPPAPTALKIQPYAVKTLSNGLKVGMFGLMGVDAETVAPGAAPLKFGNVSGDTKASFMNRVATAQAMVSTLRNTEGCDVVVCLSHMGTSEEEQLADLVPSIDAIVGGHSHDLNYPPIIRPGGTIIVQAKSDSEYLGNLELQYDPAPSSGRKVTVRNAQAIHMDQTVASRPDVATAVGTYKALLNGILASKGLPSSTAAFEEPDLNGDGGFAVPSSPEMSETQMGDLITDAYRSTTSTQIAIEANGVIRDGIAKGASGIFSFYDLYRPIPLGASPYDSPKTPGYPLCAFYLDGAEIQAVLNQLLYMNSNTYFVQISGLKYTYDPNAAPGRKVVL